MARATPRLGRRLQHPAPDIPSHDCPHVGQELTMSRNIVTVVRRLALATFTLAAVTACQNDGPSGPKNLQSPPISASQGPATSIKIKPTFYFNGILFQGHHDASTGEIYSMNPDGSSVFRLTNDDVIDADPDVSPNAPAFIWARFAGNGLTSDIWSQNLDGSKRKRLTDLNTIVRTPRYSPDGKKIAFTAVVPGAGAEIFTMNADGTGITRLTTTGNNSKSPTWSPDGAWIAYQSSDNNGIPSVWVMGVAGNGQTLVTSCPPPGCSHLSWSPIANEIAVDHIDGSGIIVIDGSSGAQVAYIPLSKNDIMPAWSKDGKKIIFSSVRSNNGTYDLFSTEPLRGGVTSLPPVVRLTTFLADELTPAYSK
jgi:Tol biopolymer transport system component